MLADALVVGVSAGSVAFALVTGHAHGPAGWARRRARRAAFVLGGLIDGRGAFGRGRAWRAAVRDALDCVMCSAAWAGAIAGLAGWGLGLVGLDGLGLLAGACVPGVAIVAGVVVRRIVRGG